jgi:hypothetical protein
MAITSYQSLKAEVADTLNRTDLSTTTAQRTAMSLSDGALNMMVANAESRLRRDPRCKKVQERSPFTVSGDATALPSDFGSVKSLRHDGTTYYFPISIVSSDMLPALKLKYGPEGPPQHASVVAGTLRFAPVPNASFSLKLEYWTKLTALSDTNTTNWLLNEHPDIYYYATLFESAPYLQDDDRLVMWDAQVNKRLDELYEQNWNEQNGGTMTPSFTAIG